MVISSGKDVHQGIPLIEHIMHGFILLCLWQEPAVGCHAVKFFLYDPHDGQCVLLPPFVVVTFRPAVFDFNEEILRKQSKLDSVLQRCNIRLSNYVSNVDSKSYKAVVRAISQGITAPEELVRLIHGRIINHHGIDVITASLKGVVSLAEIDMISQLRDELDMAEAHKEKCQARMLEICEREFPEELRRLQTIPGIKERAATSLIAEIGTDMNKFETANHLASWSGLKPRNDESNKKIKSRSITHGNVYLRKTIIECAWAASRTKDCFFSWFSYHQTQVRKKNKMKVLVAVARKMLIAVWHVLHDNTNYIDFTTDRKTAPTRR